MVVELAGEMLSRKEDVKEKWGDDELEEDGMGKSYVLA